MIPAAPLGHLTAAPLVPHPTIDPDAPSPRGEVDESRSEIRVEVTELSWFSTIVRDLTGLYDYTSEDAQIKSCEVSSESVESSREFSTSAEVDNRSVEEKMYLEVVITDTTRGFVQGIESEGKRVDTGSTQEFSVSEHRESITSVFEGAQAGASIVTLNGESQWGDRTYFVEDHNGSRPGYFLAHDELVGHEVSLGSWYIWEWGGDGLRVLAIHKTR